MKKLEVTELKMCVYILWACGHTLIDHVGTGIIRDILDVDNRDIAERARERERERERERGGEERERDGEREGRATEREREREGKKEREREGEGERDRETAVQEGRPRCKRS